jgi:ATP-dependent RNA circularization protein (DNA/RNA ligase family)
MDLQRLTNIVAARYCSFEPVKYPRTPHLPWSEGASDDDILLDNAEMFEGKNVVVTEKMDGENTTMTFDKVHARSPDSRDHPSRHMVKSLWSQMRYDIPQGMRICGENLYAKHSIAYESLPAFFLVFAIFEGGSCLSWSETVDWCHLFGLKHVPVLYAGPWDKTPIMQCYTGMSKCGGIQEGYVTRNAGRFSYSAFSNNVAKVVRKGHVQTSEHWMMQKIVPNRLIRVEVEV